MAKDVVLGRGELRTAFGVILKELLLVFWTGRNLDLLRKCMAKKVVLRG